MLEVEATMSIGALSERTGVPVETLRVWERRYAALAPRRSSGSHRRYDLNDVERVTWLAARVAAGQRISAAVAALDAIGLAPRSGHRQPTLAQSLVDGSIRADPRQLEQDLDRAFDLFTLTQALELSVFPALSELATRWVAGENTITAEHMLSESVTRRLSLRLAEHRPSAGPPTAIFCPSGERHVIGALALAVLVTQDGRSVAFLGANTPVDDVAHLMSGRYIGSAVAVCTMPDAADTVRASLEAKRLTPSSWSVAGPAFANRADGLSRSMPFLGTDLCAARDRLRELAPRQRHNTRGTKQ